MKKLPFILIIFFSLALFLVNTEVAYPICSDESDCEYGRKQPYLYI